MKRILLGGFLLLAAAMALPSMATGATFEPGVVKVDGYDWSVSSSPVSVQLNQDGQTTYTIEDILKEADRSTSQFSLANVPGVEIALPGPSVRYARCTGNQVRAGNDACPTFIASADKTTMIPKSGQPVDYTDGVPTIYITKQADLEVTISPRNRTIKSGTSVEFTATVTGASGPVVYDWNFGDGKDTRTSGGSSSTISHTFTGNDKTFNVVVTVATGTNPRTYDGLAVIKIGKAKSDKKKRDKTRTPKEGTPDDTDDWTDDGGYIPGYNDGGYDDTGGTGDPSTGSPSPSTPNRKKKKQEQPQPVDTGQTVTGELIDPAAISSIAPPADTPAGGTEEAAPAEDSKGGGGGIPKGVSAALGIGALLGLGGLAEAGAFTGAFRRFRLRP